MKALGLGSALDDGYPRGPALDRNQTRGKRRCKDFFILNYEYELHDPKLLELRLGQALNSRVNLLTTPLLRASQEAVAEPPQHPFQKVAHRPPVQRPTFQGPATLIRAHISSIVFTQRLFDVHNHPPMIADSSPAHLHAALDNSTKRIVERTCAVLHTPSLPGN